MKPILKWSLWSIHLHMLNKNLSIMFKYDFIGKKLFRFARKFIISIASYIYQKKTYLSSYCNCSIQTSELAFHSIKACGFFCPSTILNRKPIALKFNVSTHLSTENSRFYFVQTSKTLWESFTVMNVKLRWNIVCWHFIFILQKRDMYVNLKRSTGIKCFN